MNQDTFLTSKSSEIEEMMEILVVNESCITWYLKLFLDLFVSLKYRKWSKPIDVYNTIPVTGLYVSEVWHVLMRNHIVLPVIHSFNAQLEWLIPAFIPQS